MTTPGPRTEKWRVRKMQGSHPVLDANSHPFTQKRCPPALWLKKCKGSPELPNHYPKLTVSVRERVTNNGDAKILRPWRLIKTEEPQRARTPETVVSASSSDNEAQEQVEPTNDVEPDVSTTCNESQQGEQCRERARSPDAAVSSSSSDTESEELTQQDLYPKENRYQKRKIFNMLLKIGVAIPVVYHILDVLPETGLRTLTRVLSVMSIGSVLHLIALPNADLKASASGSVRACLVLIGAVGVAKLKQHLG